MAFLDSANYELPYQSGSDTSEAAARKAHAFVGKQGQVVYDWIRSCADVGSTQREASEVLDIGRPSIAARFHALEQQGLIRKTAARRDGCVVYEVSTCPVS